MTELCTLIRWLQLTIMKKTHTKKKKAFYIRYTYYSYDVRIKREKCSNDIRPSRHRARFITILLYYHRFIIGIFVFIKIMVLIFKLNVYS